MAAWHAMFNFWLGMWQASLVVAPPASPRKRGTGEANTDNL